MSYRVVIPARFGSERLPGKPLVDIHGKPMIVRVAEAVAASSAAEIVVATDDERIFQAVNDAGYQAQLTRTDHQSGSDRVMEVVTALGWPRDAIVLNVQGDEPLIPAAVLEQLVEALQKEAELGSATLCEPLTTLADLENPNIVKVVRSRQGRALYFSRAPIPFDRSSSAQGERLAPGWWRHVGVYGYRVWA
ncbi:MAG: 3-deoxy-manno-octulosonate cytidylyltransferase, partial [Pseudomonadota bacterium]